MVTTMPTVVKFAYKNFKLCQQISGLLTAVTARKTSNKQEGRQPVFGVI